MPPMPRSAPTAAAAIWSAGTAGRRSVQRSPAQNRGGQTASPSRPAFRHGACRPASPLWSAAWLGTQYHRPRKPGALSTDLAQAKPQALFGQRLFEKTKRVNGLGPVARLRIGIGGDEDAANAKALANFVSGIDAIARTNQANVHEHHVWTLPLGDADRLLGGNGDGDDDMAHRLQQASCMQGNVELILDDQDAQRAYLQIPRIALLGWDATAVWTSRGQPKVHRLWSSLQ